jgi:hypothetical protein
VSTALTSDVTSAVAQTPEISAEKKPLLGRGEKNIMVSISIHLYMHVYTCVHVHLHNHMHSIAHTRIPRHPQYIVHTHLTLTHTVTGMYTHACICVYIIFQISLCSHFPRCTCDFGQVVLSLCLSFPTCKMVLVTWEQDLVRAR